MIKPVYSYKSDVTSPLQAVGHGLAVSQHTGRPVGGGERIHPETARKSGRHGVQYAAHREGMCGTGAGCLAIKHQSLSTGRPSA